MNEYNCNHVAKIKVYLKMKALKSCDVRKSFILNLNENIHFEFNIWLAGKQKLRNSVKNILAK